MYAPNEYYRPYNPSKGRDRYRERQRLPAQYVSGGGGGGVDGKDKTPTFRMLSSPASPGPGPAPASLNTYSSLNTVDDLLPGPDKTECYCRISSLVKAFVFLGILLGATVGLVIFFLAGSAPNTETLGTLGTTANKNYNLTNRDHFSQQRKYSESSENFLGAEGELNNRNKTLTTQSPHAPTTTQADQQNIRDEYQKVLNGFDDGEYNLDVKELLGEISGDSNRTTKPEDASSDQSDLAEEDLFNGKGNGESAELPPRDGEEFILTSSTSPSLLTKTAGNKPSDSNTATVTTTTTTTTTTATSVSSSSSASTPTPTSSTNTTLESSISEGGELMTETVFGFLNLVTTVRDTVIVFTTLGEKSGAEQILSTEVSQAPVITDQPITTTTTTPATTTTTGATITTEHQNILIINPTSSLSEDQSEDITDSSSLEEDSEEFFVKDQEKRKPKSKFQNLKLNTDESEEDKSIEDERHSAQLSFKERLAARFKKFREEHGNILEKQNQNNSGSRSTQPRKVEISKSQAPSQSEGKKDKEKPKFGRRTDFIRKKLAEVLKHQTSKTEEATFQRTFVPSFLRTESKTDQTRIRPTIVRSLFTVDASTRAPFSFNRNRTFKKPQIRKNILNKILGRVDEEEESDVVEQDEAEDVDEDEIEKSDNPDNVEKEEEEEEREDEEESESESEERQTGLELEIEPTTTTVTEPLRKTAEVTQDIPIFQQFSTKEFADTTIQSSLEEKDVSQSTSVPTPSFVQLQPTAGSEAGDESTIMVSVGETAGAEYEVATIRSAYSFLVSEEELSTRYITVTRTSLSQIHTDSDSTLEVATISSGALEVATIRSPYSFQVDDEGQESTRFITVTRTFTPDISSTPLPSLPPPSSLPFDIIHFHSAPLESSLVSEDIVTRTAVIPVVLSDGGTSLSTLRHSFTVTNTLTIEPTASSDPEHKPTASFIDIDRDFDSEESINRESFLPLSLHNNNQLSPEVISVPEPGQLSYLDLLAPKVVTVSSPVVKTETDFLTTTIRLLQGNSAFTTTLVEPQVKTVTEWGEVTSTLPLVHPLLPTTTVLTQPVTVSTVLTQTDTQSYRVIFRAKPITTTVLDTRIISTVLTTFNTQTVTLPPSLPLLG